MYQTNIILNPVHIFFSPFPIGTKRNSQAFNIKYQTIDNQTIHINTHYLNILYYNFN